MRTDDGRRRVVIEGVSPEIDCGRFPAKRAVGENLIVEADVLCDGHGTIRAVLRHRHADGGTWTESEMEPIGNDRWRASFPVTELGRYEYTIVAWADRFESWQDGLRKKADDGQEVSAELLDGAELAREAAGRANATDRRTLRSLADRLEDAAGGNGAGAAFEPGFTSLMRAYPDRSLETEHDRVLQLVADPPGARFSTWYELFPRSAATEPGRHGTFDDVRQRLPYVARMGFDVLYLPPVHPIGATNRKGRNYAIAAGEDDPGSPWAIGSQDGGHTAIHPELGTFEDFDRLVADARTQGMSVAMDLAYQCSRDHPWVKEHPEWFRHRPDGTIRFAENPPKRYEDIYPLDFETEDWEALWRALKDIVDFWIDRGIRIFRVDNPHTKSFAFWEWMIGEVKAAHPDVVFLSEAFTRPRVMYRLAKLGFTQSYTYFTWRNTKWELQQYFAELAGSQVAEYLRPNLWPNTPDILSEYLQYGGRAAFTVRLILAATLGANYGIYGPAFELCVDRPLEAGREVYLDSEKFEVKVWNWDDPTSLADLISRVNHIRRSNPALQGDRSLRFHDVSNDALIAYSKASADGDNVILVVANLDPHHVQAATLHLPLEDFGLDPAEPYQVHDLLTDARYLWNGPDSYVELNPHSIPAHIFRLRHRVRSERDFDYFM